MCNNRSSGWSAGIRFIYAKCMTSLHFLDRGIDRLYVWLINRGFLKIARGVLECVTYTYVLCGMWVFLNEIDDREKQASSEQKRKQYDAWLIISSAHGKPGSGGRIQALEDLNRDGISLEGIDVSKSYLQGINLAGARLHRSNFSEAILVGANLTESTLHEANLTKACLINADLTGAVLGFADLSGADLTGANLTRADLYKANLKGAVGLTKEQLSSVGTLVEAILP